MAELQNLAVDQLFPHPDNPRRDTGDVTELAESIRANGILQNLTVVPSPEGYRVIIGHRRLAAAKLAGLSEIPCVVREMSLQEQIRTMLMENIQRSDLTVYEQAQGFQTMLDLGETVESIAKESGFSTSTVRRRVKLLDLDAEKFREADARGATLTDYLELDKIQDPERKNQVLDTIGTANFRAELKKAISEEERLRFVEALVSEISQWATEDADVQAGASRAHVRTYSRWNWSVGDDIQRPEDADTRAYYYRVDSQGVTVYADRPETRETEEENRKAARNEAALQRLMEAAEITRQHWELRWEFVDEFRNAPKFAREIMLFAAESIHVLKGGYDGDLDLALLGALLDIPVDWDTDEPKARELYAEAFQRSPERSLLAMAYVARDHSERGYWYRRYENGVPRVEHKPNDELDAIYGFLTSLGYEMSDEEKAMQDGTHPLFRDMEAPDE